ncbi:MAG: hypothetical protein SGJ27_22480 [Candidatus Melainabacteria bacterium]|nr:hypothetical protein [Candidatus Melainabacteria bacterium]
MSSLRNIRRAARLLRTVERFVRIEMHPSVYVSVVAINLCLVFAYREFAPIVDSSHHHQTVASEVQHHDPDKTESDKLASNFLPGDRNELPTMIQAMVKPVSERLALEARVKKAESSSESEVADAPVAKEVESAKPAQLKSAGAALAAVPEKISKPRKKSKRMSRGLVPPPPPGVCVVPPPPNAPSLYAGHMDPSSFLVAPPPPMVLDESFSIATNSRSHKGSVHNYGKKFGNERSRTVHNGTCQQVIVSR